MTDPTANIPIEYHNLASGDGDIHVYADGKMHVFYGVRDHRCIIAEATDSTKQNPVYISLNGVTMYKQQSPVSINGGAYAQVWLNFKNPANIKGNSYLNGGSDSIFSWDYYGYAGLHVAENAKFALRATDELCYQSTTPYELHVQGGVGGAGIGGHQNDNVCSGGSWLDIDVSTNYHRLYVNGGTGAAGIGAGQDGWCDRLYISRGYIIVRGGTGGAGIGSGRDIGPGRGGECDGVTITGGHIEATGGTNGAGIGGGKDGNANAIWIQGKHTYIRAEGIAGASGIGGGDDGDGRNIRIEGTADGGPTIYAYSYDYAAAIGGGDASIGSDITLRHCRVTATAGGDGAGIGGGGTMALDMTAAAGNILIENASIVAKSRGHGAGIGGGYAAVANYPVNNITVKNSSVSAYSMGCGAGIGGGSRACAAYITIENSTVDASSAGDGHAYSAKYNGGAGIGSGAAIAAMDPAHDIVIKNSTVTGSGIGGGGGAPLTRSVSAASSSAHTITIENSTVNVRGNYGCAGIGGGASGDGDSIQITGSNVYAQGGQGGAAGIGGGAAIIFLSSPDCNGITITDSQVQAIAGSGSGAGIGGGNSGAGKGIVFNRGNISASGDYNGNPDAFGGAIVNGYGANVILPHVTPEGDATIEDGTMYFYDLCSKTEDFPGHMEINGGSVNIEKVDGTVVNDAGTQVYKTTATLPGGRADAGKKVTLSLAGYEDYHDEAIWADGDGKIYLWLPFTDATQTATVTVEGYNVPGGFSYAGRVETDNTGVLTLQTGLIPANLTVLCRDKTYDGLPAIPSLDSTNLNDAEKAKVAFTYQKLSELTGKLESLSAAPSDPGRYTVTGAYPGSSVYTSAVSTAGFTIRAVAGDDDFIIDCPSKAYDGQPVSPTVLQTPPAIQGEPIAFYYSTWDGYRWSSATDTAPSAIGNYKVVAKSTVTRHASNEVIFRIYQGSATAVHTVVLSIRLDGGPYTGKSVMLRDSGGMVYALTDGIGGGDYANAAVLNGVYTVYMDGAAMNKTVTVAGADVNETVDFFTVSFDGDGGAPTPPDQIIPGGGLAADPGLPVKTGSDFQGWYTDDASPKLWIFASDTVTATVRLKAGWTVPTATIRVSPAVAAFPQKTLDYYLTPAAMTFTVTNSGSVPLSDFAVTSRTQPSDYLIQYTSREIPANGGTATFTVQPRIGLALGNHEETLDITSTTPLGTPVSTDVSFPVVDRVIQLSLSPGTADFSTAEEGYPLPPAAQTVTLTYTGNFYALVVAPPSDSYTFGGFTQVLLSPSNPTVDITVQPRASLPAGVYDSVIPFQTMTGSASTGLNVQFTVTPARPAAAITRHPQNVSVSVGKPAVFSVAATGDPAPRYQWQVNTGSGWVSIAQAESATYEIPNTLTAVPDSLYRCVVYNRTQTVHLAFSDPAKLTLTLPMELLPCNTFPQGCAPQLTARAGDNPNITYSGSFLAAGMDHVPLQNGVEFDGADGSILLHFRRDYLNALPPGPHTLQVTVTNGVTASAVVQVTAPGEDAGGPSGVPLTGDGRRPMLWLILLLVSGAGLSVLHGRRFRRGKTRATENNR